MPRNQGTSRKGKPKKGERASGMGRALARAQQQRFRPKLNGSSRGAGMAMAPGTTNIGEKYHGMHEKSVLETGDLEDFLTQAEMAHREFASEKEQFVVLDATGVQYQDKSLQPKRLVKFEDEEVEEKISPSDEFQFQELFVPRRPQWDSSTTAEELDQMEKESFLNWRRAIAQQEEELQLRLQKQGESTNPSISIAVTPFEKNLHVWRQLWRVLERATAVVQIVDGRQPLFYLSKDLRKYATEELGKPMMVVVNKSDFLSLEQRKIWRQHLFNEGWKHVVFFSAYLEQTKLDEAAALERQIMEDDVPLPFQEEEEAADVKSDHENHGSEEQVKTSEAGTNTAVTPKLTTNAGQAEDETEQIVEKEVSFRNRGAELLSRTQLLGYMKEFSDHYRCVPDPRYDNRIQFGMVGFPNVGKSSVINVLIGSSKHTHGLVRVGVASQPGKTKHFQTLLLEEKIMLCDCPGLVFPSLVSSTADLIAAGVYPIAQMRDHFAIINLICRRIPREIFNATYGVRLPEPSEQEMKELGLLDKKLPPPTAEELLDTYCRARSLLAAASGVPDYPLAARTIVRDYVDGKLLYCHPPSSDENEQYDHNAFYKETIKTALMRQKKLQQKIGHLFDVESEGTNKSSEKDLPNQKLDKLDLDDEDIMGLLGGPPEKASGGNRGKKHKSMQKWGKKGRKNRNKDPYGCHSTPDDALGSTISGSGVTVKAGKYSRQGYTRPSYVGAKGVSPLKSV